MEPWVWAVLLLILGIGLAVLEVFIASAGVLAFLSASAIVAAVVVGFHYSSATGIAVLFGALFGLPTVIILAFKYLPKTPMGRRLLLAAPTSQEVLPEDPEKERLRSLVGHQGVAKTKMLLSGRIVVNGRTVDAVSEGMPIEVGQTVEVVQVRGLEVVVRPIETDAPGTPPEPLQRTYDEPFEIPPA